MRLIDIKSWNRKKQYDQFSSFQNPCYTVGTRIDVTELVRFSKERKLSFFACFIYALTKVCNEFEGYHLRMDQDKNVIYHDIVDPSYTVALPDNGYDTCVSAYNEDLSAFCSGVKADIEAVRSGENSSDKLNSSGRVDVLYFSCAPWVDMELYSNPLPLGDLPSMSIPRINWTKYVEADGKYTMHISFTVNHALMDGYELSHSIIRLQDVLNSIESFA